MENFDIARKAMETSMNSQGSAMAEQEKWLESLEAKTNQFKAAWEGLSQAFMNDSFLKNAIDAGTNFLSLLTKIIDKIGAFPVLMGALGASLPLSKNFKDLGFFQFVEEDGKSFIKSFGSTLTGGFKKIFTSIKKDSKTADITGELQKDVKKLDDTMDDASDTAKKTARVTGDYADAQEESADKTKVANGAIDAQTSSMGKSIAATYAMKAATIALNAAMSFLISWVLSEAVKSFNNLIHAQEKAAEKAEETAAKSREDAEAAKERVSQIDELIAKYKELANSDVQDTETRAEIKKIQDDITTLVGGEASGLDLVNGKLDDEYEKLKNIRFEQAKIARSSAVDAYGDAVEESNNATPLGKASFVHPGLGRYEYIGANTEAFDILLKAFPELQNGQKGVLQKAGWNQNTTTLTLTGNLKEKVDTLNEAIEILENTPGLAYGQDDLYKGLVKQRDEYKETLDKQKLLAQQLLDNELIFSENDDKLSKMTVNSADSLEEYRQTLINIVKNSPSLSEAFINGDLADSDIEDAVTSYIATLSEFSDYYDEWADKFNQTTTEAGEKTALTLEGIKKNTEDTVETAKNVVANISNIQSIVAAQSADNSLSAEDFGSPALKDYTEALEYNNGALQLNAEKVRELVKEKANLTITTINEKKADAQSLYLQNAAKIEQYRRQLEQAGTANGKNKKAIEESIVALQNENSALRDNITQYDLMNASLREATDAYHNWLNAQNASDYGDMYSDALSAIERISDTFNEESDIFGDYGSLKFDAAVEFIVPDSVDRDNVDAVQTYVDNLKQYFVFDEDKNNLGMDIERFCQNAVNKGLMVLDKSSDEYQLKGKMTIEKFAEGMNMSAGMVQAFFDELKLKGGDFSWAEDGIKTIGDLGVAATEAAEKLRNTKEYSKLKIRLDVSEIDGTQKKIDTLNATINEAKKIKVDSSEVEDANNIIAYCVAQKQLLTEPIVMSVDVSKVEGKAQDVIEKIQEFQTAWNELSSLKQQIGVDTSEAQKNVNDLAKQIKNLPEKTLTSLGIDPKSVQTIEQLEQSISNITAKQLTVGLKIDQSAILGYEADSKTAEVVYGVDDSAVQAYKRRNDDKKATEIYKVDSSEVAKYKKQNDDKYPNAIYHRVSTEVDTYNPPNLTRTVTYKKVVVDDSSGSTQLNGTAHAGGDWGTAKGGRTLVGELGREIIVDPHSGKWYTVGDNGAEFAYIPQGAIVFNHLQTESLLANGYVSGRASALASGTAMAGGIKASTTKAVSSALKKKKTSASSTSSSSTSSSSSSSGSSLRNYDTSYSSSSSSDYDSSSSSSTTENKEPQKIDWIETALNRIERAINNFKNTAQSAYKTLKSRTGAIYEEIGNTNYEISVQQQAYNRYMSAANSVGLPSWLAEAVQRGGIDISEYDEDLAKQINLYKEYFDKAIACSDAIDQLHESIASLYKEKFDDVVNDYSNQLSLLEHMTKSYDTGLDYLEAKGMLVTDGFYKAQRDIEQKNIEVMQKQLTDMVYSFSEAMNSGEIEKESDAWYEMQIAINGVKESIDEATVSLAKYDKQMREVEWNIFKYTQDRISRLTSEGDFLIDMFGNSKMFDEQGNFTEEGLSVAALHAVNYNVYMAQADDYAREIQRIDKEIAENPYNTELIAYREEQLDLQQKCILAAEKELTAYRDLVKDGINVELDALKQLISAYTSSLDSAKSMYEYQRKIEKKTKNISSLRKQLSAYGNDNSEETRARVQKILVDLDEAEEDLRETEYEQFVADTKKLLDDLYLEYETNLNKRLDDMSALITSMINTTNANAGTISSTIKSAAGSVGYSLTAEMSSIFGGDTLHSIVAEYSHDYSDALTTVNSALSAIKDKVNNLKNETNNITNNTINNTTYVTQPVATESVNTTPATTPVDSVPSSVTPPSSSSSDSSSKETEKKGNPPVITKQPQNATAKVGDAAKFTIAAKDDSGGSLKYCWYCSVDGGKSWILVGDNSTEYSTGVFNNSGNFLYRCTVYNDYGSTTSNTVKIIITSASATPSSTPSSSESSSSGSSSSSSGSSGSSSSGSSTPPLASSHPKTPPSITSQPRNVSVLDGELVSLAVTATGDGTLSYDWEYSDRGGGNGSWYSANFAAGYQKASMQFVAWAAMSGRAFRCRVHSPYGQTYSSAVTVTVTAKSPIDSMLVPATKTPGSLDVSNLGLDTPKGGNTGGTETVGGGGGSSSGGGGKSGGGSSGSSGKIQQELRFNGKSYLAYQSLPAHKGVAKAIRQDPSKSKWGNGLIRTSNLKAAGFNEKLIDAIKESFDKREVAAIMTGDFSKYYFDKKNAATKVYKTGGLVDYTGLAYVDGTPEKPELMLNAKDTENFIGLRDALRAMASQTSDLMNSDRFGFTPKLNGIVDMTSILSGLRGTTNGNSGTKVGDININIPIDRVMDYNDFMRQLRQDSQFEKFVRSFTIDQIAGKGSMEKYKYRW